MRHANRWVIIAAGAVSVGAPWCAAREKQNVTMSYVLAPEHPLPEGLQAVAVIDSGIESGGGQDGELEQKWSTIAADMIEAMVQNGSQRFRTGLSVANRRMTRHVLAEQDLKLAGMVEGDTAARVGKLLDVQGLITSRITIHLDVQQSTSASIDWGQLLGGSASRFINPGGAATPRPGAVPVEPRQAPAPRPPDGKAHGSKDAPPAKKPLVGKTKAIGKPDGSGGTATPPASSGKSPTRTYVRRKDGVVYAVPSSGTRAASHTRKSGYLYAPGAGHESASYLSFDLKTRDVETLRRSLTVQCVFSLVDAGTGEAIIQYAPPPYHRTDENAPDFFFGGTLKDTHLDPVDLFIGELVEQAAQEFVSTIVPIQMEHTFELVGHDDEGEDAIRALRADDYERAAALFEAALRDEPDEPDHMFALAVVSGLMGDWERALGYVRETVAMKDVDGDELEVYLAFKDRLAAHLGRILPPAIEQWPPPDHGPSEDAASSAAQP